MILFLYNVLYIYYERDYLRALCEYDVSLFIMASGAHIMQNGHTTLLLREALLLAVSSYTKMLAGAPAVTGHPMLSEHIT